MRPARSQTGVMLLEALIGILIFSIGILALIGMQGAAIRNTTDARYRSEASFLANQIIGQMWVDRANLALYTDLGLRAARQLGDTTSRRRCRAIDVPSSARVPTIAVAAENEVHGHHSLAAARRNHQTARCQMINRINGGS